jgi:hypothetical protein
MAVDHQHGLIVTPLLVVLDRPIFHADDLGPEGTDVKNQNVLFKTIHQVLVTWRQQLVPILSADEETLAVAACFENKLGALLEGNLVTPNDWGGFLLHYKYFFFVDFESYVNLTIDNEIYFSNLFKLLLNQLSLRIVDGLQDPIDSMHEVSIHLVSPGVKL